MNEITTNQFFETFYPDGLGDSFLEIRKLPSRHQIFASTIEEAVRAATDDSQNVFFGVGLRGDKVGDEDHVTLIPGLWADVDLKDHENDPKRAAAAIGKFEFKPSAVISSGNGYHVYWLLKEPEDVTQENLPQLRGYLLGLARHIGGDPACRDLSRILRVPGTLNLKAKTNPKQVQVIRWYPERRYNLSDFENYYVEDAPVPGGPVGVPTDDEILRRMAGGFAEGEGRNEGAFTVTLRIANLGMPQDEASAFLAAWNQSNKPPLPPDEIQQVVVSAYKRQAEKANNAAVAGDLYTDQQQQHHYRRLGVADLRKSYVPTRWMIDQIIPAGGIVLLGSEPSKGKTWLGLDAALGIATGKLWVNRFACEKGRVLLVLEEDDPNSVKERMDLLYVGRSLSQEEGDSLPIECLFQQGVSLSDEAGLMAMEEQLRDFQPDLVVIDTLRRIHKFDENDSGKMAQLFGSLNQLTRIPDKPCSMLIMHHLRKRGEFNRGTDRLRGSSDIPAAADGVLGIEGDFGTLLVRHEKSKRGPEVETFCVKTEESEGSMRLVAVDQEKREEKAEQDTARCVGFVTRVLKVEGGLNKKQLYIHGQKDGYGRNKVDKAVEKLKTAGKIRIEPKGQGKILHLVHDHVVVDGCIRGATATTTGGEDIESDGVANLQEVEL